MHRLPVELQRRVLDFLPRGDQAALACTSRSLREVSQLSSLSESQRIAAALRHERMPWAKIAREVPPADLVGLLTVAEQCNRTRQAGFLTRAPKQWAFCRTETERDYYGSMEQVATIVAVAPRGRRRVGARVAKGDLAAMYIRRKHWVEFRTFMPTASSWLMLKESFYINHAGAPYVSVWCGYAKLPPDGLTVTSKRIIPPSRLCPSLYHQLYARNDWANRILFHMPEADLGDVRAVLARWDGSVPAPESSDDDDWW